MAVRAALVELAVPEAAREELVEPGVMGSPIRCLPSLTWIKMASSPPKSLKPLSR